MKTGDPNRRAFLHIARALGEAADHLAFVGGSVVGLLITDPATPGVRQTKDIDCIVEVSGRVDYDHRIRNLLLARGFAEMSGQHVPVGAWRSGVYRLDVIPTDIAVLGFSNTWFPSAIRHATLLDVGEMVVNVIDAPHFLATKLEAFQSRGSGDYLVSHDVEDIIAVIDGREEVVSEVRTAPQRVREFIERQLHEMIHDRDFHGTLPGLVFDSNRVPDVVERIEAMLQP